MRAGKQFVEHHSHAWPPDLLPTLVPVPLAHTAVQRAATQLHQQMGAEDLRGDRDELRIQTWANSPA